MVKKLPANAAVVGSILGPGISLREGNGNSPVFLPGKSHRERISGGIQSMGSQKTRT